MKKYAYWLRGHEWADPTFSKEGYVHAKDYKSARKKVSKEIKKLRVVRLRNLQLKKGGRQSIPLTFKGMCLVPNKKR